MNINNDKLLFISYFFDPSKRVFIGYLLSAFIIAFIYYYFTQKKYDKSIKKIEKKQLYWLHPSSILDYKYFIVSYFLKILFIYPLVISTKTITLFIYQQLTYYFGYISIQLDYSAIIISYTFSLFIVSDFTRYWLHRLMHKSTILWEFHKVHHSAETLNPLTFYRVHPVESILFGLRYSFTIGIVSGFFVYLFGAKVQIYDFIGVNVFLFIFSLIGSNLRHSNVPLGYGNFLEKIFISPKQHQIHHYYKYSNKNYGGYLAIWDSLFSSLQLSKGTKPLTFGIHKDEMKNYQSIIGLLAYPFQIVAARIKYFFILLITLLANLNKI